MRVLGSITNRIFLASALLAMSSIGAAVYLISARMTRETEAALQSDLTEAATLVEEQRRTEFDHVARTARLIADLPKFKAVVELGDRPTLQPIAVDYQQQAGADLLVVTGRGGELLALSGESSTPPVLPASDLALALAGTVAPAFWPHARGVMEVVSVPVMLGLDRPEVLGVLSVGYLLDDRRAARFKALTGADTAFAMGGDTRASTLGPSSHHALASLLSAPGPTHILIGGEEYVALTRALNPGSGSLDPAAIVLRSRSERLRSLGAIQAALGGIALGATLLAIVVSYAVARTISRPLATITDHMRQIAATGDLTRKIPTTRQGRWDDDDAHMLATTFNLLTDSIVRFQREAGQRERLSSLGRLSTVIAHEVRNPLMIIKGALRTLARNGATAADVRDAATDIDEETDRLNRLVNDVLDVGRPIRLDPAASDINGVCSDAVEAVATNGGGAVVLELATGLPTLVTDAERLRTVLVNLLTNAQHAVEATPGGAIRLITSTAGVRRVAIQIRDTGVGIADEDVPRIFDPYFTTRRAGTGLGLAIAKNIVDSLGASISVVTGAGVGTTFRIEIGDVPTLADARPL